MTQKNLLIYMFAVASITLSFFFGYFSFRLEQIDNLKPEIKIIDEINPKVCTVDIESFNDGVARGRIGGKQVRIRALERIVNVDEDGYFEFELAQ